MFEDTGMNIFNLMTLTMAGMMISVSATAGDFYVYPAKGQNQQQQDKDIYECQHWATGQSGFDPTDLPDAPAADAPPKRGGAVRGALLGAAVGKVADTDASNAAAWGATAGVLGQSRSNRRSEEKHQAEVNQAANQYAQQRTSYNSAYSACLTGRSYTVSPK